MQVYTYQRKIVILFCCFAYVYLIGFNCFVSEGMSCQWMIGAAIFQKQKKWNEEKKKLNGWNAYACEIASECVKHLSSTQTEQNIRERKNYFYFVCLFVHFSSDFLFLALM